MFVIYIAVCCVLSIIFERLFIVRWLKKDSILLSVFIGVLLGEISYVFFPSIYSRYLYFLFFLFLVGISRIDADTMKIPNVLSFLIFICGILLSLVDEELSFFQHVIGLFCVSVPLWIIIRIYPDSFGMGDVKLCGAGGLFMGWKLMLCASVIAILLAGVFGFFLLLRDRQNGKRKICFGPFLSIGMFASTLFGNSLISWYLSLL